MTLEAPLNSEYVIHFGKRYNGNKKCLEKVRAVANQIGSSVSAVEISNVRQQ